MPGALCWSVCSSRGGEALRMCGGKAGRQLPAQGDLSPRPDGTTQDKSVELVTPRAARRLIPCLVYIVASI